MRQRAIGWTAMLPRLGDSWQAPARREGAKSAEKRVGRSQRPRWRRGVWIASRTGCGRRRRLARMESPLDPRAACVARAACRLAKSLNFDLVPPLAGNRCTGGLWVWGERGLYEVDMIVIADPATLRSSEREVPGPSEVPGQREAQNRAEQLFPEARVSVTVLYATPRNAARR